MLPGAMCGPASCMRSTSARAPVRCGPAPRRLRATAHRASPPNSALPTTRYRLTGRRLLPHVAPLPPHPTPGGELGDAGVNPYVAYMLSWLTLHGYPLVQRDAAYFAAKAE